MIRAIVVVGWLGLAILLVAAYGGYRVVDEESAQGHLTISIFAAGALLFVDLCLLVYLLGTQRLVRRAVAELAVAGSWVVERRLLTRRGAVLAALAGAAVGGTFGLGFPTFTRALEPWVHHLAAALAVALQTATLVVGAAVLRRGEAQLAALGEVVETVRYTPPAAAASAGSAPPGNPG